MNVSDRLINKIKANKINLILLSLSLIATLILLEFMLRVSGLAPPLLVRDSGRGDGYSLIPKPYSKYWYYDEGYSRGRYNRFGLRDHDIYDRVKPEGTYRIAVVGDSFAEALQVDIKDTFENILEGLLEKDLKLKRYSPHFEVMNFGVNGWSTVQEYLRYINEIRDFSPDMVILAFTVGSDFGNNVYEWQRTGDHAGLGMPYIIFGHDNSYKVIFKEQPDEKIRDIFRRFALVRLINKAAVLMDRSAFKHAYVGGGSFADTLIAEYNDIQQGKEVFPRVALFLKKKDPIFLSRAEVSLRLIDLFQKATKEDETDFMLLIIPLSMQVAEDALGPFFDEVGRDSLDMDWPDTYLEDFCRDERIRTVSLLGPLRQAYKTTGRLPYGFKGMVRGHFNEYGHIITAKELYNNIRERLLSRAR